MKVQLYGPFGQYPKEIESVINNLGLSIVTKNPDVVITYGGDGTLLGAERDHPGIPKLPLKNSEVGFHCSPLPNGVILDHLAKGRVKTVEYLKLEATFGQKHFLALNEFSFRNVLPTAALRFSVSANPSPFALYPERSRRAFPPVFIGDGIVVATPFGSTGYSYSITRQPFTSGIGLAFNNIHNFDTRLIVLPETATATITIVRGLAHFTSDNNPKILELKQADVITIQKSPQTAKLLVST